jgi:hypothetical protein
MFGKFQGLFGQKSLSLVAFAKTLVWKFQTPTKINLKYADAGENMQDLITL